MYRTVVEAVLYGSCGLELDRRCLDDTNIQQSLAEIIQNDWVLGEGDTIKIETRRIEY